MHFILFYSPTPRNHHSKAPSKCTTGIDPCLMYSCVTCMPLCCKRWLCHTTIRPYDHLIQLVKPPRTAHCLSCDHFTTPSFPDWVSVEGSPPRHGKFWKDLTIALAFSASSQMVTSYSELQLRGPFLLRLFRQQSP